MVNGSLLLVIGNWLMGVTDNYPPGAANDPEAPYNQPLDEDEELALLQAIYYPKKDKKNYGSKQQIQHR